MNFIDIIILNKTRKIFKEIIYKKSDEIIFINSDVSKFFNIKEVNENYNE
jgi:hypothetical protein